jgi:hypothetical protein
MSFHRRNLRRLAEKVASFDSPLSVLPVVKVAVDRRHQRTCPFRKSQQFPNLHLVVLQVVRCHVAWAEEALEVLEEQMAWRGYVEAEEDLPSPCSSMTLLQQQARGWQQAVAVTVKIAPAEGFRQADEASHEEKAAAEGAA